MYLPQWVDSTVNGVTAGENGEWIYLSRSTEADDSKLNYSKILWLMMPINSLRCSLEAGNKQVCQVVGNFSHIAIAF